MEDKRKIIVCSTPTKAFESFLYEQFELRQVALALAEDKDTVLCNSFNLISVDDLEPIVTEVSTQPKNKPYGPQRNSKKGKAKKW